MIAATLVAFQLATAASNTPPPTLIVRNASRSIKVPLVESASGPLVRLEALSPIITVELTRGPNAKYSARLGGVVFGLESGVPVVRVGGESRQLDAAPVVRAGQLLVPLQLISQVLPSFVPNTHWAADEHALVVFSMIEHRDAPPPPRRAAADSLSSAGALRTAARSAGPRARGAGGLRMPRTIVVDAGHGGPDNGMTGPIGGVVKLYEKDVTLSVAKRLGATFRERGVRVVYTRTTDTLIALSDRGRIANQAAGDLFISIHVNAANPTWKDPGAARGFETYFLAEAKTEDARRVERMENESIQFEDGSGRGARDDALGFILSDMAQNEHLRESSELADMIQQRLGQMHPGPSRGVKQAGFRVLVTAYMPAVLVEIGFGTNPREADFLLSPSNQQAIASAIADAAMEYLQRYERRVAGPAQ